MLEIEVKCPVSEFAEVERRLSAWGARADPPRQDADQYFNAPDRDFARTDEAFRLRRIGQTNRVTYKGPKREAQTKTRTELEVALADGDEAAETFRQIVIHLGFRPVAVVRKLRQCFHLQRDGFEVEITLDEVADLGRFVEAEIVAAEDKLPAAREALFRLLADLDLHTTERRSYLEMLLAKTG